ncbi:MAG: hypothetical protein JWR26_4024 [Pedosphaera sp.]|nr:hypothetical protein [Pedosphaera sp.]
MKRYSQQGVALVITLIMLSVITFMAVTFLVLTRREAEQVNTLNAQNHALNAAAAGVQQAEARLNALMLGTANGFNFSLQVSTNYQSLGFFKTGNLFAQSSITNVNYYYADANGNPTTNPLSAGDLVQMYNNQIILPRPPVFIFTNKSQKIPDFPYFLDLNRNGLYDTNGLVTVLNDQGIPIQVNGSNTNLTSIQVGDPEWIGVLDHPDQPHSSSNRYIARYAFIALPIGNSLDVNYIHNDARGQNLATPADGFLRNQGAGSWEINLAGFLQALNTNQWGYSNYYADANGTFQNTGSAFDDAASILRYRYNGTVANLSSFGNLYPYASTIFGSDFIDWSGAGPLMTNLFPLTNNLDNAALPWSGADNPNQLFSHQDFFTSILAPIPANSFVQRLTRAGTGPSAGGGLSTYDRYTFYRMLSQMSVGSAPDDTNKLNLNYVNVGGTKATSFQPWSPLQFFTSAADKLLANAGYTFTTTNIPVYNGTNFAYTPAIHRVLQLAANIYDASTNRAFDPTSPNGPFYPSVFRPLFNRVGSNVFISGYTNEEANTKAYQSIPLSLPEDLNLVGPTTTNIYGVPWVIGAKKGFPNFNEFSMQIVAQVTRKLQVVKPTPTSARSTWKTNQMYVIGISNVMGLEAWNSYSNVYPRAVDVIVFDSFNMVLTNQNGVITNFASPTPAVPLGLSIPAAGSIIPPSWAGFTNNSPNTNVRAASFRIPLSTNVLFLPDSAYRFHSVPSLVPTGTITNILALNIPYENSTDFPVPQFGLNVTNRLRFIMLDHATGRIIDYVTFNGMDSTQNITAELTQLNDGDPLIHEWNTNRVGGANASIIVPTKGIVGQVGVSSGNPFVSDTVWNNAQLPKTDTKQNEIDKFNAFINGTDGGTIAQVPFTPTRKISLYFTWQANDPLVHYTLGDLTPYPPPTDQLSYINPSSPTNNSIKPNIGLVNTRYLPWGGIGNPNGGDGNNFNLAVKDPMVSSSDDWQFPTNKFPNIGWLGRVHRGTPWQTVYLKSTPVADLGTWLHWAGSTAQQATNNADVSLSMPTNDWRILDVFTTAPNENASRGQLSINQTNLAAWAAIFDGMIAITNTSTDVDLFQNNLPAQFAPVVIDPNTNNNALLTLVTGINKARASTNVPGQVFTSLGQILSAPELTVSSPFLNTNGVNIPQKGLNDAAYERIPQQVFSLLRVGTPRYVIFAYGQGLKPADHSIVTSGQFIGLCTNYAITSEVVTRTVVRFENAPQPVVPFNFVNPTHNPFMPGQTTVSTPRAVIEGFNVLGPD